MDKTAIRNFAIEARNILMKSAITEAGFYGITKDGCKDPVQKGKDFEVYETVAGTENRIFGDDIKRRANLVTAIKEQGFDQVIEETAYTWFNRIIAIRFMEVNNYLPTRVRVLSSETGSTTPDIVTQSDTVELNLSSEELERIQTAKRENRYDDAFRSLFIKQCNELNAILPGLFEKTDDYMELLLKITYTGDGVIRMLVDSIPEDNFNVETEGQVEIIGWMYQYYNTELKDDTFAKLKKNVKITKERIPAATQLFTPDWIVRYMVENSLGRVWIEHLRAIDSSLDEKAKAEEFGWKYYLPEAEQEDDVQAQLVEIRKSYKDLTPQDITCIDPCMGSGHILVYMFDVLMDIYRSEGFSEREAVFDVLEKNIRGLDIDRRAYQLSYFALMMKARGYNRIFFRGHEDIDGNRVQAIPKVYAIEESNAISRDVLNSFGGQLNEVQREDAISQMNGLLNDFYNARTFGSITNIGEYDWNLLKQFIRDTNIVGQMSFEGLEAEGKKSLLNKIICIAELLFSKYDAVITNPPYMGAANMDDHLTEHLKTYYPDSKGDLFAAFIEKGNDMTLKAGFNCMVTMQSWMFLSSFEKMRKKILKRYTIANMVHMDNMVMGIAFGTAVANFRNLTFKDYKATYTYVKIGDLVDDKPYEFPVKANRYSQVSISRFEKIPGMPVAYWINDTLAKSFVEYKPLKDYAEIVSGMTTGNNALYMRNWKEVDFSKVCIGEKNIENVDLTQRYWFPYNKGGAFRRWYGNNDYLVNWSKSGEFNRAKTTMKYLYLKRCITWSDITSGIFSARACDYGFFFDVKGSCAFPDEETYYPLISFLNSKIVMIYIKILNPTVTTQVGDLKRIPFNPAAYNDELVEWTKKCVQLGKEDYDYYETSWDFKKHPLVEFNHNGRIEDAFGEWELNRKNAFEEMRYYEEKIQQFFIDLYDLANEVDAKIEDKNISIHLADRNQDIRSLISYAVGCMFGRYSLDYEGLMFAGGKWNDDKYKTFLPDIDNIIPITDEEYFEDDIVSRFIEWVKIVFGKEHLDENLEYISNSLNVKGNSPKEILRSYFTESFYNDHNSVYYALSTGKTPVYWMFDAGDENSFKCLMYLHRYTSDIVGRIRTDYLTKAQSMIENALKNAEYAISTSSSAVDIAQATKKRDKYIKQLAEIRAYYPALSHMALQKIELNLDDGVKVNYAKFQGIEVSIEGEKKQVVDLLAKI